MQPAQVALTFEEKRLATEIRDGMAAELKEASRGIPFRLLWVDQSRGLLNIGVESSSGVLDASMEECTLRWVGEREGRAEIVSVLPEFQQLYVVLTSGVPPQTNQTIWINPPKFLGPLLELWFSDARAREALQLSRRASQPGRCSDKVPTLDDFPELRKRQRESFKLLGYETSFLWGPPGTGKTYTLGCIAAAYLKQRPEHRVLLLSSTNNAVDHAMLAANSSLDRLGAKKMSRYRFGSRFDSSRYQSGLQNLIPVRDRKLVNDLSKHMKEGPSPSEPHAYKIWRERLDELKNRIRLENQEFLFSARLAAMTASYAVLQYSSLEEVGRYDVVIFDEASQMSLAHAMMLARVGRTCLFAGDHKQLSPIVQSKDPAAAKWIGRSPFAYLDFNDAVKSTLDEQSRMAPPICEAVSELFYNRALKVAAEKLTDTTWIGSRTINCGEDLGGDEHVTLLDIPHHAQPILPEKGQSKSRGGYKCVESAEACAFVAAHLLNYVDADKIVILTPYRAQRAEIASRLTSERAGKVTVSTVHRAQGSERLVVIFDPVRPSAEFIRGDEGQRLFNVAISRAEGRLLVCVHPDYLENSNLRQLTHRFSRRSVNVHWLKPAPKVETARVPMASVPMPAPFPALTMLDEFKQELLLGLKVRRDREERRAFIAEVAYRRKYRSLGLSERDEAIAEISKRTS